MRDDVISFASLKQKLIEMQRGMWGRGHTFWHRDHPSIRGALCSRLETLKVPALCAPGRQMAFSGFLCCLFIHLGLGVRATLSSCFDLFLVASSAISATRLTGARTRPRVAFRPARSAFVLPSEHAYPAAIACPTRGMFSRQRRADWKAITSLSPNGKTHSIDRRTLMQHLCSHSQSPWQQISEPLLWERKIHAV